MVWNCYYKHVKVWYILKCQYLQYAWNHILHKYLDWNKCLLSESSIKKDCVWGLSFQSPLDYSSSPKLSTCKLKTLAPQIPVGSLGWLRVLGVRELDQTREERMDRDGDARSKHTCAWFSWLWLWLLKVHLPGCSNKSLCCDFKRWGELTLEEKVSQVPQCLLMRIISNVQLPYSQ